MSCAIEVFGLRRPELGRDLYDLRVCAERPRTPMRDGFSAHAAVSPATLHRRFRAQLGTTPLAWLTAERVARACRLIGAGEIRLDVVAARSGLGTGANLRARLCQETGLSPTDYRRRFGPAAAK